MRCIFLVPESEKLNRLQELRLTLDPLALKVPPHITVVFPFDLPLPRTDLEVLLAAAAPMLPIEFALGAPELMGKCWVFPVTLGCPKIIALQECLLSGLPAHLRPAGPFLPHVTFGRLVQGQTSRILPEGALDLLPFTGTARRLVLERIGEAEESIVEFEVTSR